MSVGGVGGVGGAGGAGAGAVSAGPAAGAGGTSPGGAPAAEGVTSSSGGDASSKDVSDAGDKAGTAYNMSQIQNNSVYSNMSTQDSTELHNCANGIESSSESGEIDLKKLIEMMMAIKLLEAMNENEDPGGGFSTIA
jgi:hypothetical protein